MAIRDEIEDVPVLRSPIIAAPPDVTKRARPPQLPINHELGHGLGYGHVARKPLGSLAKVMRPQALSLRGCRGNAWPHPDGA